MALPKFLYGDPSKHVDYVRRKRKEHEERHHGKGKEGLEAIFKSNGEKERKNEQRRN